MLGPHSYLPWFPQFTHTLQVGHNPPFKEQVKVSHA